MGRQPQQEPKLFYSGLCLKDRIPQDHLLRKIRAAVDFDFTYGLVRKHYGVRGNVSVPPQEQDSRSSSQFWQVSSFKTLGMAVPRQRTESVTSAVDGRVMACPSGNNPLKPDTSRLTPFSMP